MIIIQLTGGLGNQLFQYAFARSLSHDLNKKLYVDLSFFSFKVGTDFIIYGLHPYNIKGIIGNYSVEGYKYKSGLYHNKLNVYEKGSILTVGGFFYRNKLFENLDQLKFPAYFTGFYCNGYDDNDTKVMTEKFFEHNKNIIRDDLQYLLKLTSQCEDIIDDMKNHDSIALHIRRGNYEDIPRFGTCSLEYYQNAIEKMASEFNNPKFFVFSNDYEWFEENINLEYPYRKVDVAPDESDGVGAAELLKLMSSCKHFIISNSTFSWWGAWLSDNTNKKIIAPTPWFQSREIKEVETIDGVKPIHLPNNYEHLFNTSKNSLYKLNNKEDFKEINGIYLNDENGFMEVNSFSDTPNIILNSEDNRITNNGAIIKFSLKTNSTNAITIYHKNEHDEYIQFKQRMWYYDEEFTHYIKLPSNISIDNLKIQLADSNNIQMIIKEIEIKEL